jgi:hypothetical protein
MPTKRASAGYAASLDDASFPIPRLGHWNANAEYDALSYLGQKELEKNAKEATAPIYVVSETSPDYGAVAWPCSLARPPVPETKIHLENHEMPQANYNIQELLISFLLPPLQFTVVAQVLTFHLHYSDEGIATILSILGVLPVLAAFRSLRKNKEAQNPWDKLIFLQLLVAYVFAFVSSHMNFWCYMAPFYHTRAMKSYTEIDPSLVSGQRLLDAGKIDFVSSARVVTDLGMSFTSWDIYCVAPISTPLGLPSQGSQLASYDFWAVGVNCCHAGAPDFRCGEYSNIKAHSGYRMMDEAQTPYFRLAVDQAQAVGWYPTDSHLALMHSSLE